MSQSGIKHVKEEEDQDKEEEANKEQDSLPGR